MPESRRLYSLATKMEILQHSKKGKTYREISIAMGIPCTTIYDTVKNAAAIKAAAIKAAAKKAGTEKKHVLHSLATKMEVLRRSERGQTKAEISRALNISSSTIRDMLKVSFRIKALAKQEMLANKRNKTVIVKDNCKMLANKRKMTVIVKDSCKDLFANKQKSARKRFTPHPLSTQLEVVRRSENGERIVDIARAMGLARTTTGQILKRAKKIKAAAEKAAKQDTVACDADNTRKGSEDIVMENMERLLKIWMEEQLNQHGTVTNKAIQRKALSLWKFVWDSLSPEENKGLVNNFTASTAWLKRFKQGTSFSSLPIGKAEPRVVPQSSVNPSPSVLPQPRVVRHLGVVSHPSVVPQPSIVSQPRVVRPLGVVSQPSNVSQPSIVSQPIVVSQPRVVLHPVSTRSKGKPHSLAQNKVGVARGFSSLLRAKIEVGGYTARQVINMNEMLLCWKKLPHNTIISVDEKAGQISRASRDQFSLMLGANATGDLKLKPLLVYHAESPHSLRGYIKEYLPVVWRSHPRGRVVSALCQNYVVDYISQKCKEYAMVHNLRNRFLLLVDNGPAYPSSMDDWADNIEVMFVPTMTSSVVQPMDHGISAAFRLCYLGHLLEQLVRETDTDDKASLCDFWQNYNVRKALNSIKMAWDDVTPSTLNAAWRSIWPECVQDSSSLAAPREPTEQDLVGLAHQAGFLQVTIEDIKEQMKSPCELTSEELFQMEIDGASQEHEENSEMEAAKTLDIDLLKHTLGLIDDAMTVLEQNDPNCTRSCDMRNFVEQGIRGYRELYANKKRKAQNTSIFCPHFK